jgi:hypothetical protein
LCDHALKNRDHKVKKSAADSGNMLQLRQSGRDTDEIRAMQSSERQPGAGPMDLRRQT